MMIVLIYIIKEYLQSMLQGIVSKLENKNKNNIQQWIIVGGRPSIDTALYYLFLFFDTLIINHNKC